MGGRGEEKGGWNGDDAGIVGVSVVVEAPNIRMPGAAPKDYCDLLTVGLLDAGDLRTWVDEGDKTHHILGLHLGYSGLSSCHVHQLGLTNDF